MTLHNAIVEILEAKNQAMSTQAIADELNRTKTYQKRDFSEITDFQVHGRTRKYPHLFERNGQMVSLLGQNNSSTETLKPSVNKENMKEGISDKEFSFLDKKLMNTDSFKTAIDIDNMVPRKPGLYCIRINDINALSKPFNDELEKRHHDIVYIGIASKSLYKRMLNQELRANGHGTFFRSLGAVLGFRPIINSLSDKKNKRNYKFQPTDENKIIDWINNNLMISWVVQDSNLECIETQLLQKYQPLLNIAKNPAAIPQLSVLRKECVDIANGKVKEG